MLNRLALFLCVVLAVGCYERSDLTALSLAPSSPVAFAGTFEDESSQVFRGEHVSLWGILAQGEAIGDVASPGCTISITVNADDTLDAVLHKDGTEMGKLSFPVVFANGSLELPRWSKSAWLLFLSVDRLNVLLTLWLDKKNDLMMSVDRSQDMFLLGIPFGIDVNKRNYVTTHKRLSSDAQTTPTSTSSSE